ncbi:MAG: hypothetical protein QY871_00020 [Dehalococcoides mccartyi]|uniref:hypothetical protein n=1 Tax=Dehalococcoides mccartyi TaxID=61435 RepID=UPI0025C7CEE6|nr:hypothetical protein [Dehalococcoides mccartyi]MDN4185456.1 hypothetical protein [Dehalococcoides mccartyi]
MAEITKWHTKKVLITARTYPVPSKKSIEVSCTAGITDEGDWVRLFPIPWRFLDSDKRFKKYQYIEAEILKSSSDPRSESYKINIDTIKIISPPLSTNNKWESRKNIVYPKRSASLCQLQHECETYKIPTLGIIKPQFIKRLIIEKSSPDWTESELAKLRQYPLFGNANIRELKKLPFTFKYEFQCEEPGCKSHTLSCVDWEMGSSYLNWINRYGDNWESKFREKWENTMINQNDTHFYVGTVSDHPNSWIIIGLFYPLK